MTKQPQSEAGHHIDQRFYQVQVGYLPEGSEQPEQIGTWCCLAATAEEAKLQAFEELWEPRLDAASCRQWSEISDLSDWRYITCDGWGHIFVGKREEVTRWVFDQAAEELVTAQILNQATGAWSDLDKVAAADLKESLGDNDLLGGDDGSLVDDVAYEAKVPLWAGQAEAEQMAPAAERVRG